MRSQEHRSSQSGGKSEDPTFYLSTLLYGAATVLLVISLLSFVSSFMRTENQHEMGLVTTVCGVATIMCGAAAALVEYMPTDVDGANLPSFFWGVICMVSFLALCVLFFKRRASA